MAASFFIEDLSTRLFPAPLSEVGEVGFTAGFGALSERTVVTSGVITGLGASVGSARPKRSVTAPLRVHPAPSGT